MENNFDEKRETLNKIRENLLKEIQENSDKMDSTIESVYYNEYLGDTSFFLAVFLEFLLENNCKDWNTERWFDDSLITKFILAKNKLKFWGVMIWGIDSDTEQWTEPFYCELDFDSININHYLFLFGDKNIGRISYSNFHKNPNVWSFETFLNGQRTSVNRTWMYEIDSNDSQN